MLHLGAGGVSSVRDNIPRECPGGLHYQIRTPSANWSEMSKTPRRRPFQHPNSSSSDVSWRKRRTTVSRLYF